PARLPTCWPVGVHRACSIPRSGHAIWSVWRGSRWRRPIRYSRKFSCPEGSAAMSSVRDFVYGELRRRLMAGAFLPGERLREEHIAVELSVSRTPVRSAIDRLVADGLVKREEGRGASVLGWQARDIDEAF